MIYTKNERLLTVKGLNLQYGQKVILRDINLKVDNIVRPNLNQGQCIALLGPSGIGKTQLFRCIAGLQKPSSGEVLITEKQEPVKSGDVGVVQQAYPLLQHRTIRGNLELVSKDKERITTLLTKFGLDQHADKFPVQLSGGQRQRIAIIQQLLRATHYILMDEPFSGLDPVAKDKVCELITEVNLVDELNTTIFTTHDLESAAQIADTIWVLGREQGKDGATIVKEYDLIALGLAWQPNVRSLPGFSLLTQELRTLFNTL